MQKENKKENKSEKKGNQPKSKKVKLATKAKKPTEVKGETQKKVAPKSTANQETKRIPKSAR